jgi:hypothetical protein
VIPIPACSVVTTPVDGRLSDHLAVDTPVRIGDVVARVHAGGRDHELRAVAAGRVGGPLLRASQPVRAGEPVVWVTRGTASAA